ncbi:MAG: signal peptidase I [Deltaproteobacteria bacterium]|nr:signal peptidase I [Deltaproteobacteria bacterium]
MKEKIENLKSKIVESSKKEAFEAIGVALIIALLLRAFVVEAFVIPSPSMVPTLLEGDFILVNKFVYGLRVPFTKKRVINFRIPKRGEVIVFMFPHEQAPPEHKQYKGKDFIKRVIGLPGDKIRLGDYTKILPDGREITLEGQLFVNDEPIQKIKLENIDDLKDMSGPASIFEEELKQVKHLIRENKYKSFSQKYYPNLKEEVYIVVPQNSLFVMGDNRDNSSDSRAWGFVPMENLKGKALFIWMSLKLGDGKLFWNIPTIEGMRTERIAKILI